MSAARSCYIAGLLLFSVVFLKNAWVSDDAYILFRSLEQLLEGHGPRWNPHERVQVFTCPLWYWLLAAAGTLHRDHYLNSIMLSAVCNVLLLWNLQRILAHAGLWLLAIVVLVFSQAFFDFTTSGLENALAYCLLSFVARFHLNREQLPPAKALLYGCMAAGLLLVTRHDLLLFVLPPLLHSFWCNRSAGSSLLPAALALAMPLALWTLFSLAYYGFPLPNTAYAKLGIDIPRAWLIERGASYFGTSVWRDFISVAVLPAGLLAGLLSRHAALRSLALGIALHLAYVVWIGGDFMRGRFFSWDVLLCTIALLYPLRDASRLRQRSTAALLAIAAGISWVLWEPPLVTPLRWGAEPFRMPDTANGVTQERHFFFHFTALWKALQRDTPLLHDHGWCQDSLEQQRQQLPVTAAYNMGFRGYCLGTGHIVVDLLGITDPLLARMPRHPADEKWRPGHVKRLVPAGYCASLATGSNRLADPETAQFYDRLRLLTAGEPLLGRERLLAIWQMNTGAYREQLARIQQGLVADALQGGSIQQQATVDCPLVELPPTVIEQLKKTAD